MMDSFAVIAAASWLVGIVILFIVSFSERVKTQLELRRDIYFMMGTWTFCFGIILAAIMLRP